MTVGMTAALFAGVAQNVLFNQSPDPIPTHGRPLSKELLHAFTVSKKVRGWLIARKLDLIYS